MLKLTLVLLQCAAFKKKNMRIYRVTTSVGRQFPSLQPQFPSEPCTFCQRLSAGIPKVQEANHKKSYLSSSGAWRYFQSTLFVGTTCKRLARSSHASEGDLPVCLPSCEFAASAWAWAMPTRHRRRQKKSKATESERKPFQGPVANRDLQIRICVVLRPG